MAAVTVGIIHAPNLGVRTFLRMAAIVQSTRKKHMATVVKARRLHPAVRAVRHVLYPAAEKVQPAAVHTVTSTNANIPDARTMDRRMGIVPAM